MVMSVVIIMNIIIIFIIVAIIIIIISSQKALDQFRFLGNCPPTPPLSHHFSLSEK